MGRKVCNQITRMEIIANPLPTHCGPSLLPSPINPPVFLQNCRRRDVLCMCRAEQTADSFGLAGVASHMMIT